MNKIRRISVLIYFSVVLLLLLTATTSRGQFVAFNGPGPGTNTTAWNIFGDPPGATGPLKNVGSGAALPVTVAITTNGLVTPSPAGDDPLPGTPLYNTFHGFVSFAGVEGPDALAQISGAATVTYTFNGLNPQTIYSFKAGVVGRGSSSGTDPQEWSLFQISGTPTFTSAYTPGSYTSGLAAGQVALNTGVNTNGDMVDWESIVPDTNGSFSVSCMQYTGQIPGGAIAGGPFGYALSAFRLEE